MSRTSGTVPTPDGSCPATLHLPGSADAADAPNSAEPRPGVLLYPDAAGRRETFAAMGDRLADLGYAVLVPDVYYRLGDWAPFDAATVFGDPKERARLGSMASTITPDIVARDAGAYLEFLLDRPETSGEAAGVMGYCLGGWMALTTAGLVADRIAAVATFHGGQLAPADEPNSPHLNAHRMRATVYVAAAQDDHSCPPEQLERLDDALTAAGVEHEIETYPAAHGFAVADNGTYDPAAAERHWAAVERVFGSALH